MKNRYPIILVYGIFVKEMRFFKAFGGIEKTLKKSGFDVYTARTDAFGSVANNALQLKEQIEKLLEKYAVDKVNIIAYSKGGLDARYLIEKLDTASQVASVTTICAPHRGSKYATKLCSLPKFLLKFATSAINLLYRILGDKRPDSLEVLKGLRAIPDEEYDDSSASKGVYCQSYSSYMLRSSDDLFLCRPFQVTQKAENSQTDGAVTARSAAWGEYKGHCLDEPLSHRQVLDFMVGKKKRRKVHAFYLSVCQDLAERGF